MRRCREATSRPPDARWTCGVRDMTEAHPEESRLPRAARRILPCSPRTTGETGASSISGNPEAARKLRERDLRELERVAIADHDLGQACARCVQVTPAQRSER